MINILWEGVEEGGGSHFANWEVVHEPVNLRGLGIGSLILCNESLLTKWLWCFFTISTCCG